MRDIYLIDFENVASDGLSGITFLDPEDEVIIFYSNNSNRLSMKMHILIGRSVCKLTYFEAAVGGKNALDHQLSTWLGYLVGTGAAERNYYLVSRDAGYKFVASFWGESELKPNVRCVDSIRAASRIERSRLAREEQATQAILEGTEPLLALQSPPEPVQPVQPEQAVQTVQPKRSAQRQSRSRQKSDEPRRVEIMDLIAPYPMLQESHLQQLIADSQKQKLCNHLRKHLGQEKGLALYNEIKKRAWH